MSKLVTDRQFYLLVNHLDAPFKEKVTVSEALDWIREEKGVACGAGLNVNSDNRFLGNYIYEYVIENNRVDGCLGFSTHPLAESALLNSLLDYLSIK